MKNIKQILRHLEKNGFRIEHGNGSIAKIYPLDNSLPFYSCHLGERAIHPMKRFAKKHWQMDLSNI